MNHRQEGMNIIQSDIVTFVFKATEIQVYSCLNFNGILFQMKTDGQYEHLNAYQPFMCF